MWHVVGGTSLYVQESGAGDPSIVFLHYWGGTHRTWSRVVAELEDSYRTITYDMRGWGQSEPAESGYSIVELANDAALLIEQLALTRYVLVGHSMGGKVAQLLASRHPAGLIGLVLVAPAPPAPAHFPEEALQRQLHAYDNRETVLQTIAFLSARTPDAGIVEQIVEDSLSGAPKAKLAWPTSAIREDISAEVRRIAVPTLILAGEHDRLDSLEQHRREVLARITNSKLQIIPGSGHLIPVDEPVALARAIEAFVTSFQFSERASSTLQGESRMSFLDQILERNQSFATQQSFTGTRVPSLPQALPDVKAIVIGCADMRVDPAHVLGLEQGEAVVMRNIGGRITPGLMEQMGMLGRIGQVAGEAPGGGGEFHLIVLQHTDCGITRLAGDHAMLTQYFQIDDADLETKAVTDPRRAVAVDVATLQKIPVLPAEWLLSGLVYDVATGLVGVVVPPAPIRSPSL